MNTLLLSSLKLLLLLPLAASHSESTSTPGSAALQENFLLHVPSDLIRFAEQDQVQQSFPVSQCIAGSRVRGSGQLAGRYQQNLMQSSQTALWNVDFQGVSSSNTRSTQQRVTVRQSGNLQFHSNGQVRFDFSGFRVGTVTTSGNLRTRTTSVYTPFKGVRRRIALRKVREQSGSSRRIAERLGIRDISSSFRRELQTAVSEMNRDYQREVLRPLQENNIYPRRSSVTSNNGAVQVGLCFADSTQENFAAPVEDFYRGEQLRLAVHQQAVNFTSRPLAGETRSLSATLKNVVSDEEDVEGSEADLQIEFADKSPFGVFFEDDMLRVTLRGEQFERGGQVYGGMEISFAYRTEFDGEEQILVLEGEPVVQRPPDEQGKRAKLGLRDLSLRRILVNILERDLPRRISVAELELPIPSGLFQPLEATRLQCRDGWLVVEADRQPTDADQKNNRKLDTVAASYVD